jgi:hypothetical protein
MAFAPQGAADLALVLSAVAAVAMLLLALGARLPARILRRRPSAGLAVPLAETVVADVPGGAFRYTLLTAAACGLAVELFGVLVFAPRFGALAGPVAFLLVLTGIGVRRLVLLAAVGMAIVPLLYLTRPVSRQGGAAFSFAIDHLWGHWIAAGAICAILGAAFLQARGLRRLILRGTKAQSPALGVPRSAVEPAEHTEQAPAPSR